MVAGGRKYRMRVFPESAAVYYLTVVADHYQFFLQDLQAYAQWMRSHGTDPDLAPVGPATLSTRSGSPSSLTHSRSEPPRRHGRNDAAC